MKPIYVVEFIQPKSAHLPLRPERELIACATKAEAKRESREVWSDTEIVRVYRAVLEEIKLP